MLSCCLLLRAIPAHARTAGVGGWPSRDKQATGRAWSSEGVEGLDEGTVGEPIRIAHAAAQRSASARRRDREVCVRLSILD